MKNDKKNIVIINSVAINGGDEALLLATILGLKDCFSCASVTVLCDNPKLYSKYINYVEFDWDWEYAFLKFDANENRFLFKIKKLIRYVINKIFGISFESSFSRLFSSSREKRVYSVLKKSSKIILSAGGYIHDFYNYNKRLGTLEFIDNHLHKPYYFFSQSIGPFWKKENYSRLIDVLGKSDKIILREEYSLKHLKMINYNCENTIVCNDVAFYLYDKYGVKPDLSKTIRKVAINFREWHFEEEGKLNFNKALKLCRYLISKGFELTFISTCQGVESYIDDSKFAERIMSQLTLVEKNSCMLLNEKYTINEFINIISRQDAYVGMRLHGAILSLIGGIPALNIAYEDKTFGIFNLLGLSDSCFSYKESEEVWLSKVDLFIENYIYLLNNVEQITNSAANSVKKNFKLLL